MLLDRLFLPFFLVIFELMKATLVTLIMLVVHRFSPFYGQCVVSWKRELYYATKTTFRVGRNRRGVVATEFPIFTQWGSMEISELKHLLLL